MSKKLYSLILIIALSTCIQSLAISWVLETSDAVNSLPPETLQPLLFPKNGGITDVASTNPFRGSSIKNPLAAITSDPSSNKSRIPH